MISILCPTRLRPHRLREMVDSVRLTMDLNYTAPNVQVICYVSDDDDSYPAKDFTDVSIIRGPRLTMSDLWNALIPYALGDILMQGADDIVFRTMGWNAIVEQAFAEVPDKILLAFGDDMGPRGKTFSTLPFLSRKWIETVGYMNPPGFSNEWFDAWTNDVADMIGRKRLLPIQIEHRHWIWGKAPMDQTYRENIERDKRDNNAKIYADRLSERLADAEKLRKVMI